MQNHALREQTLSNTKLIHLTAYSVSPSEPKTVSGTLSSSYADVEISEGVKIGEQSKSKPTFSSRRKNPYLVISN